MIRRIFQISIVLILTKGAFTQSFAPAPGFPGSSAIHQDSSVFVDWAIGATIVRGPLNIQAPGLGLATYGLNSDALGFPDGVNVVSLGDGGEAIIIFQSPIINGQGPDFAVFENGFVDHYMEFAFVEVSSDGVNFFRFDGVSEAPTDVQLSNFSLSNCAYINNLAGKYRQNYGTPFDLEELNGQIGLDLNNITHVKLIDVVGSIDPLFARYDSQNNIINDPYPTEFESGGFDLDAIGVINSATEGLYSTKKDEFHVYPNPSEGVFYCKIESDAQISVYDIWGKIVMLDRENDLLKIDLTNYVQGVYYLSIIDKGNNFTLKLIKQ